MHSRAQYCTQYASCVSEEIQNNVVVLVDYQVIDDANPQHPSAISALVHSASAGEDLSNKTNVQITPPLDGGSTAPLPTTQQQSTSNMHAVAPAAAKTAPSKYQRLVFRNKLYELREERDMKPETFPILVSALLYEKRFGPYFCQPVIAGLGDDD
ncbi:hypothetical protein LWI29_025980 [Acer saccharum]|uniref:Uncharacterized protein n=1 Tax=Acer saccharum TaxID=4024 RepID=A0AA39RNS6_ACESA|nr:hypothetical protein LWI29_025980 [Acer saccharum]